MKPSTILSQQIEKVEEYISGHWKRASEVARELILEPRKISQIFIGGCGDSHHAALGLEMAFGEYSGLRVAAMESMSLARYAPSISSGEAGSILVIGISNSGEVARTIEALETWGEVGARTLALTSDAGSTLARKAEHALVLPAPEIAHGPGLLSYIGSLLLGYATLVYSILGDDTHELITLIGQVPGLLHEWLPDQIDQAILFAEQLTDGTAVFLGSGPARGSALFGAAKAIEAAGERCWAQDVEEWAHLEYFCDPADMPTILLSALGRARSRELEVIEAMDTLGRARLVSEWGGGDGWSGLAREALSPLALWVAPCAYASRREELLQAEPFRGFGGGRSREEGGGASRIRSSLRMPLKQLKRLD